MAILKKDMQLILSVSDTLFDGAESLHGAVVYGVKKSYSDAKDKGEFLRELVKHIPVAYAIPVGRFAKHCGLNVSIDKSAVVIGGVLDAKKQREKIAWAVANIGFMVALVEDHVKKPVKREKKDASGTFAEQATAALAAFVKRQIKANADVGAVINEKLNGFAPSLQAMNPSAIELEMLAEALSEYRTEAARELIRVAA